MEVSSFFRPVSPNLYLNLAKKGIEVSLVLERPIYIKLISDYRENVEEFINLENTRISVCDNKKELASSIVTDLFITLSLVSKDGDTITMKYHEMVSFEKSALSWGRSFLTIIGNV